MGLLDTHKKEIEKHLAKYPDKRSAVMPLLYIAQEEYGHITEDAMKEVGDIVGLDTTHIKGLIGFYTMYYDRPKGAYLLQICTDLPCALKGAEDFSEHVCQRLGVQPGETTEDGVFTVENVMCLAACDRAPTMQVNFHYHEDLNEEKVDKLLDDLRRDAESAKPYSSKRK
jgi:NADH-quinone oxidoreductase subunit E